MDGSTLPMSMMSAHHENHVYIYNNNLDRSW